MKAMRIYAIPIIIFITNLLDNFSDFMFTYFKNSGLIILLALILFSCEEPGELGPGINPDADRVSAGYVEIPMGQPSFVLTQAPISGYSRSSQSGRILAGRITDPIFGTVVATTFAQIAPTANAQAVASEATLVGATLDLTVDYTYGRGVEQPQTFSLHRMLDTIPSANALASNETREYDDTPIATGTFSDIAADTVISFNIETAFAEEMLGVVKNEANVAEASFKNIINGLTIVPSEGNTAMVGFNPAVATTILRLTYNIPGSSTNSVFNIVLWSTETSGFTNFTADRSGTILAAVTQHGTEYESPTQNTYLQAGAGIAPSIDLAPFQSFLDTAGTILINKANLEVERIQAPGNTLPPPNAISMLLVDDNNDLVTGEHGFPKGIQANENIIEDARNGRIFGSAASSIPRSSAQSDFRYIGDITLFLELFEQNNFDERKILMYPSGMGVTVNQAQINPETIKLKIYYTRLK